ncbi:concanavalin A-like lectin/glucanase domain-containing protein [Achaetomium macrosporum]|uniref:Concanavalin A-like lectin/glucanase domain-containing protein n=1 Tax=Achaetomium macrosporum TaxID=79813 RepID=A0AAN7C0N1_9PEZI|nr:concanavalin A-like lectin/glucanase domain-containing protein [Achaetomium macrosporum]
MEMQSIPSVRQQSRPVSDRSFLSQDPFQEKNAQYVSRPSSFVTKHTSTPSITKTHIKFTSSRLVGEYEKPWLQNRDPRMKYDRIFFWVFGLIGCSIGAYIVYTGWTFFTPQNYCLIWEDDFAQGINKDHWTFDIQTGGFGLGSFEWTTDDPKNAYTDAEGLHIVPTLTIDTTDITEAQLLDGYTLNLTKTGQCTSDDWRQCSVRSNKTSDTIINPVRSARLVTRGKQTLRYGKIEVVAKLPKGDWLWPAIWMMPEDSKYGEWPKSGEIDIMESRGNDRSSGIGRNAVGGALHWGPSTELDMYFKTVGYSTMSRGDYSDSFHTFGLLWSPNYILVYVDMVLKQSIYVPFETRDGDMYARGGFGSMDRGNGPPGNPWALSPNHNAPFDEAFYLILNVGVGGTNGYFPDGVDGKPWADKVNGSSAKDFWKARNSWEPTWGEGDTRGMTVKKVSMWNVC